MQEAKTSLRILHVVDSLEIGGLERVVTNLAIEQQKRGYEVTVFSINATGGFLATLQAQGVGVLVGNKRGTLDLAVLRLIRLAAREIDVIHSHNFVPNYYAAIATIGMRYRPVLTSTCHDMGTRLSNRRLRWLYLWSLRRTARVAMVGQQVYEHFTGTTGYVSSAKADTVLNGVPVEQFEHTESLRQDARTKLGIPANALVIGCVGRLVALKNHQILLDQIPALAGRHPNLQVVLAGDGPLLENLRAQVAGLGVVDRVNFLGPVNNIAALLPAFDIFALPSKTEGLSIALLEACAAGLAVVATRVGGNPEIVIDGVTGRLVEVDNAQELARALDQMLSQPAVRQKLGSAASEWVRKHASMEALQTAYDVFYNTARSA